MITHFGLAGLKRCLLRRVACDLSLRSFDNVDEFLAVAKKKLLLFLELRMKRAEKTNLRDLLPHVPQVTHFVVQVLLLHLETAQLRFQQLVVAIYMSL